MAVALKGIAMDIAATAVGVKVGLAVAIVSSAVAKG
jgi:hypothetical protein